MQKLPFVSEEKLREIIKDVPTPFHLYNESGIRKTARGLNDAFSWNTGYREYYAVKACPNPFILKLGTTVLVQRSQPLRTDLLPGEKQFHKPQAPLSTFKL